MNPVLLHVVLVVAILNIFVNLSTNTARWLLDCLKIVIELCLTERINIFQSPILLTRPEELILNRIPKTITTAVRWLNVEPSLIEMNCCESCFALYSLNSTPEKCTHHYSQIPGGPPNSSEANTKTISSEAPWEPDSLDLVEKTCGHPLLHFQRGKKKPLRRYAFQRLADWIARFLSCPGTEERLDESLQESQKPFNPNGKWSDIHESKVWKEFRGPDGGQYTATSGNLMFGMFVDAINPYGNKTSGKHASITFVVMVCLTLPLDIRYQPENIFLVGIAPGPREPSLERMNWVLRPIVTELQALWDPGLLFI